jgi:hypothetical protein
VAAIGVGGAIAAKNAAAASNQRRESTDARLRWHALSSRKPKIISGKRRKMKKRRK